MVIHILDIHIGAIDMPKTAALRAAQAKYRKGRQVSVVMPDNLLSRLNVVAQDTGKSKAALALEAIEAYLCDTHTRPSRRPSR